MVKVAVWRFRRGITVNGKVTQMHPRYRWRDRRGKRLREAADSLIVETGDQDEVRVAYETSTREAALRTAVVYRTHAKALKAEFEQAHYGEPDEVQFEMCEFTDGRVAQRWRVGARSCAWWDSYKTSTPSIFTPIPTTARASNGQMATSRNCSGR